MKKTITNKARYLGLKLTAIFFALLLISGQSWGQQVIGSFPYMNGGFEGQSTGALLTTLSSTNWTRQNQTGASSSIVTTSPRSGVNYATVTNVTTVSRGLQSPQLTPFVAGSTTTASTAYVVQYFVKNAATVASFQGGVTTNGTSNPGYSTAATLAINASWTKQTHLLSTSSTAVTSSGLAIIGRSSAGTFDVDDVVIYAGSAVDVTAPNSSGTVTVSNATTSSLDVSWGAASGGVDGGGYVVVRYASDPGTGNDPNQNGIYAVGNTVATGGTVRYIGTGTSFTDNVGMVAGTPYWYKVYTVDKAFNYSDESNGNGTTSSAGTPTLSVGALSGSFGSQCINGTYGPYMFTITGTSLTTDNISVGSLSGFSYSTTIDGSYTSSLNLTQSGGAYSQDIYVKFSPTAPLSYDGNIVVGGGGASSVNRSVTGSGINTAPTVTTPTSANLAATTATLGGNKIGRAHV